VLWCRALLIRISAALRGIRFGVEVSPFDFVQSNIASGKEYRYAHCGIVDLAKSASF